MDIDIKTRLKEGDTEKDRLQVSNLMVRNLNERVKILEKIIESAESILTETGMANKCHHCNLWKKNFHTLSCYSCLFSICKSCDIEISKFTRICCGHTSMGCFSNYYCQKHIPEHSNVECIHCQSFKKF